MRVNKELARQLVPQLPKSELSIYASDPGALRDDLDMLTCGDLDTIQMDILQDLVSKELEARP